MYMKYCLHVFCIWNTCLKLCCQNLVNKYLKLTQSYLWILLNERKLSLKQGIRLKRIDECPVYGCFTVIKLCVCAASNKWSVNACDSDDNENNNIFNNDLILSCSHRGEVEFSIVGWARGKRLTRLAARPADQHKIEKGGLTYFTSNVWRCTF